MTSPVYEAAFASLHGYLPLDDREATSSSSRRSAKQILTGQDQHDRTPQARRPKTFWLTFTSLCLSEFSRAVDAVVLPVILPGIVADLHASTAQGYMSGSSFLLFQTVCQPVYAGFAQAVGNKTCILAALVIFSGGSALTGFAQSPVWLIGARAMQGAGAGGMDVVCGLIVTDSVVLSERGKFYGFLQIFGAVGLVAGMLLASVIETAASWRWVFFINPFLCVAPITILGIFHHDKARLRGFRALMKTVDWSGMLLISIAFISLLYGLLAGGQIHPWASAGVLVPLALGSTGVVVFVLHQAYFVRQHTPAAPLIPLSLFSHRTSATGYVASLLHSICLAAFLNFFFIYLHVSSSLTILQSSLTMLPTTGFLFSTAAVTGILTSRTKRYTMFLALGSVLMTAGFASFIHVRETASRVEQLLLQVPTSIGAGMIFPARFLATQAAQKLSDIPSAAATLSFVFNLGQCFAIPLGAIIYQSTWDKLLRQDEQSGVIPTQFIIPSHDAEESGELIRDWPAVVAETYRHIMAVSISKIWIVMTVLSGVIIVIAITMREVPLVDHQESNPSTRKSIDEATAGLIEDGA